MKQSISAASLLFASSVALAQETSSEISDDLVCLRYVRAYERSQDIPQGLLTAISYVESGRTAPGTDTLVPWPWTINAAGRSQYFESKQEAVEGTLALINEGVRSIDVGCMQINLRYHPNAFRSLEEAFEPSANVAYGAQHLRSLRANLGTWPQAVERYHSSDDGRRADYRERVLNFWEEDARLLILDEVEQEDTDTPYHRAYKDFAAGRFENANLRYRDILSENPTDKVALMGLAMTENELGRTDTMLSALEALLKVDPQNDLVRARITDQYALLSPSDALSRLEALIEDGAGTPDLFAHTGDYAQRLGDNEQALGLFMAASDNAPDVAKYHLNAAIIADRLQRTGEAVAYYDRFIAVYRRNPILVETSVDGIEDRVRYLRTLL